MSDWKTVTIGDIAKVYDGTHQTPNYVEDGVPFYSVEHVTSNNFADTKFVSQEVYEVESRRVFIEKGDILMTRIGDVGKAKYIDWDAEASFYVSLALIKCKPSVEPRYLTQLINSSEGQREIWGKTLHVAFPNKINLGDISKCVIGVPDIDEQKRIVAILETWDEYLEKINKKIERKKHVKKGLMQRLLTAEMRLPGFSGAWTHLPIGTIGKVVTGNTPPKDNSDNYVGDHYWATAEDFKSKFIHTTKVTLSLKGSRQSRIVPKGSILVTCIASIGKNAIAGTDLAMNQQINAVIVDETYDNEFFYYQIGFSKNALLRIAGAGAMPMLNKQDFSKIKMFAPKDKAEQTAIANVLSVADKELDELLKLKSTLTDQRKYLVNNLVSGKTRTPQNLALADKETPYA